MMSIDDVDSVRAPEEHSSDRDRLNTILLSSILIFMMIGFTFAARSLLLPIFLALFLAILFGPLVQYLRRRRIPEFIGAGLIVMVVVSGCGAGVYFLAAPVQSWIERGPYIPYQTRQKIESFRKDAAAATKRVEELANTGTPATPAAPASSETTEADKLPEPPLSPTVKKVSAYLLGTVTTTTTTFLAVIVVLFFMLGAGRRTVEGIIGGLRDTRLASQMTALVSEMNDRIARYFQMISLINVGLGICTAGGLALIEFPNPFLWGFTVAILNYLPFVGPLINITLVAAVALVSFDSWLEIVLPPLIVLALNVAESQFMTPALVGRHLQLNPIAVIISIMFWTWVWGLIGAILAVPILTTAMIVLAHTNVPAALLKKP